MNVEFWNSVFQWGSVVLVAITFVLGAGALVTGNRINAHQTSRLKELESQTALVEVELAKYRERAAKAEKELLEVRQRMEPRTIRSPVFWEWLKKAPSGKAIIEFQDGAPETAIFAMNLQQHLSRGGWEVAMPKAVPSILTPRRTALAEIVFISPGDGRSEQPNWIRNLWETLQAIGFSRLAGYWDATLPADTLLLLIGPKL